jgi:hypothetical protein
MDGPHAAAGMTVVIPAADGPDAAGPGYPAV